MELRAIQNKKGFTLLETVIAMTILTVMMLGTLQALMGTYTFARNNTLRDHAVAIAEDELTRYRNIPYASLTTGTINPTGKTVMINNSSVTFTIQGDINEAVTNIAKTVQISVSWNNKGVQRSVTSATIVGS